LLRCPSELSSEPSAADPGWHRECPWFLDKSEDDRLLASYLSQPGCSPLLPQPNRPPTPTPAWRHGSTACCSPARRSHAVRWRIVARPNTGSGQTITRRWSRGTGSRCPQKRFCSEPTIRRVTPLYVGPPSAGSCALCGRPNPERAPDQPSPRFRAYPAAVAPGLFRRHVSRHGRARRRAAPASRSRRAE
jgi:hypothetical protein